jgi:hypothetical protein
MRSKKNSALWATVVLTTVAGVISVAYWAIAAGGALPQAFLFASTSLALFKLGLLAVVVALLK